MLTEERRQPSVFVGKPWKQEETPSLFAGMLSVFGQQLPKLAGSCCCWLFREERPTTSLAHAENVQNATNETPMQRSASPMRRS
ncbi:MAG: hypothetical protein OK454_03705 [Thaumarchaeota archaeon]|nr:hypothetical protein [Nitrososphaerota archaeon]